MPQVFDVVYGVCLAFGFVLVILNFYFMDKMLRTLKSRYPAVWEGLGSPTIFLNHSIKNGIATLRFIFKKEYTKLNDKSLSTVCKTIFVIQTVGYILLGFMFISFFGIIATSHH